MFTENLESDELIDLSYRFLSATGHERVDIQMQIVDELMNLGKYRSALELADSALDFEREYHGEDHHFHVGSILQSGAYCLWNMAEIGAAIHQLEESLQYTAELPSDELLERMGTLASWFYHAKYCDSLIKTKRQIIEINELEGNYFMMGRELLGLAQVYFEDANFLEAAATAERAITEFTKYRYEYNSALCQALYGAALAELGQCERGMDLAKSALALIEVAGGINHKEVEALYFVGIALLRGGAHRESLLCFSRARSILNECPENFDLSIKLAVELEMARALTSLNRESEAKEIYSRLALIGRE